MISGLKFAENSWLFTKYKGHMKNRGYTRDGSKRACGGQDGCGGSEMGGAGPRVALRHVTTRLEPLAQLSICMKYKKSANEIKKKST